MKFKPVITKVPMPEGNRMIRWGFGQHGEQWFARIDLWWVGFRLTNGV